MVNNGIVINANSVLLPKSCLSTPRICWSPASPSWREIYFDWCTFVRNLNIRRIYGEGRMCIWLHHYRNCWSPYRAGRNKYVWRLVCFCSRRYPLQQRRRWFLLGRRVQEFNFIAQSALGQDWKISSVRTIVQQCPQCYCDINCDAHSVIVWFAQVV